MFLNGKSLGVKRKTGDELHLMCKVPFMPGMLKAVGTIENDTLITEIRTAGAPEKNILDADRNQISADGSDLSFITV
ncbi:DUF4982 domain-containing protein [bacterium BMS3Abin03]|nr:DUF4982 domain-containing protein [bacterium BMS3Abin03]MCG6959227.1 DUF4982 domain-containing protein [bacterium BMS3Abin03]